MSITEIAVKRPLLIVVIFTVLILFGIASYFSLSYNLLPKIEVPTITINTLYHGAGAQEVESSVTKKLEDAFSSVEGLDQLNSSSQPGLSQIIMQFKAGVNIDKAVEDVQRKVDQQINLLPSNSDKPVVNKVDLDAAPVIRAGVTSNQSDRDMYSLVDQQLKPLLQNVAGVGQVNIIGGEQREIQVNIDPEKMRGYGLTVTQVTAAVSNSNQSFPAGSITTNNQETSIQYDAKLASVDQLRNTIVKQLTNGGSVYLRDVADVSDGVAKRTAINHFNGMPSIGVQIIKQSDANAVNVSKEVRKRFSALEASYSKIGLKFAISSDQSTYTLRSANAVMEDLGLAVIIVGIVMLAFLHSVRSSMFIMVALPCSIIPTFIAMHLLGFSLNLMSLMGMSLVVGILVDDSIVVLENIYRHLEMGADKTAAAIAGRNEIGFTAIAITLVDVVVFLPLALSTGIISSLLREFSLVVVFSTLMSLLVSFTITPMLASRYGQLQILSPKTIWGKINIGFDRMIDSIRESYASFLEIVLRRKRWLLFGVTLLIFGSIALIPSGFVGAAFIPDSDQGELNINLELASNSSITLTNSTAQKVEKIILARPEVTKVFTSIGFVTGGVVGAGANANLAELTVTLVDKKKRSMSSTDFGLMIQQKIASVVPGVKVTASPTSITAQANQAPIQIAIKGISLEDVRSVAEEYKKIIEGVSGTKFVKLSVTDPKPEIKVQLDREKMAILGVDASQVGQALENAFSGNDRNKFKEKGNEYDILVGYDLANKSNIADIRSLSFSNNSGQTFSLSQFADVSEGLGESVLQRSDRMNSITINSNVAGRPTGTVADEIKKKLESVKPRPGITVEWLGDVKRQADAFASLGFALITAIILVYLIMVALYESLIYPFVVIFSIPVALVGALMGLALSMETLNIFSIIGIIMLLGLVSKNAILIVDFANQLKAQGQSPEKALIEAGRERLRPILMTTLSMIFGMLPIAMAAGAGSEIKSGMAWVIIGGLTSSMILTLFVVPSVYLIVDEIKDKFSGRRPARQTIASAELNTRIH